MRSGSGGELFVLFNEAGAFVKGFDHERWDPGVASRDVYVGVPDCFGGGVAEPAFSPDHVTFCYWRSNEDARWTAAKVFRGGSNEDGSGWMLALLNGDPASYLSFARDYYEVEFDARSVAAICRLVPMSREVAVSLNPTIDYAALLQDLAEIGYPTD